MPRRKPKNDLSVAEFAARLKAERSAVYRELEAVWEEQVKLDDREARLKRERDRLENLLRTIEEHSGDPAPRSPALEHLRAKAKFAARRKLRSDDPLTIAEEVAAVLAKATAPLTAAEVHARLARREPPLKGAETVEDIRVVLSRYAEKHGWERVDAKRPARWRKIGESA